MFSGKSISVWCKFAFTLVAMRWFLLTDAIVSLNCMVIIVNVLSTTPFRENGVVDKDKRAGIIDSIKSRDYITSQNTYWAKYSNDLFLRKMSPILISSNRWFLNIDLSVREFFQTTYVRSAWRYILITGDEASLSLRLSPERSSNANVSYLNFDGGTDAKNCSS